MFYYFVSRQRCRRRQVDEAADEEREGQGRLGAAAGRHQQELGRGQGGLQQTRQFKGKVDGKDFFKHIQTKSVSARVNANIMNGVNYVF